MADLTHEAGVIGSILIAPETIAVAAEIVAPADFIIDAYRVTYEAALSLYYDGKPIDPIEIRKKAANDAPNMAMTSVDMIRLAEITPTAANIEVHARSMKEDSNMRKVRAILVAALEDGVRADDLIDSVVDSLSEIQQGGRRRRSATFDEMMGEFSAWLTSKGESGLKVGHKRVDNMLGGMAPGELILLAARPGVGKSAFAGDVAKYTAMRGKKVVVFSAEMSTLQFSQRFVANASNVKLEEIMSKEAKNGASGTALANAIGEMRKLPLYVYDHPGISLHDIRREIQRLKDVELVIADYIQLLESTGRSENRNLEVAKLSGGLKKLAKEFEIPILALSQLNRGKDETDEPGLPALRDSGSLEQDADSVMLAWKLEVPEGDELTKIGLKVAKNRMGKSGTVVMYFDGAHMSFKETAEEYVPKRSGYGSQFQMVSGNDPDFPFS